MANWSKIISRGNVQDRRAMGPVGLGGLGLGGVVLFLLFSYLGGGDVSDALPDILNQTQIAEESNFDTKQFEGSDTYEVFVSTVLGSINDMWAGVFNQNDLNYIPPQLVLFRTSTTSACGVATSAVGPHYCPLDETIYLDETFFDELSKRFGAKGGDVAQAYVIAHEVGHHTQYQLGLGHAEGTDSQDQSIAFELQADCFAGLWAYSIKDKEIFLPGEISEALDAASAVGDDRIQQSTSGRVNPETWTHGSSTQRVSSFMAGFNSGSLASCGTFN